MKYRIFVSALLLSICLLLPGCPGKLAPTLVWSYIPDEATIWTLTVDNTADGGFIIGGGNSSYNMHAVKLGAAGGMAWDATYSNIEPGPNQTELWRYEARSARQTPDGGYILLGAGNMGDDVLPDKCFLLVKTDNAGTVVWSKAYAPADPNSPSRYCSSTNHASLRVTSDGGYVAFGSSYVGPHTPSILKTDAEGNEQFCKVIDVSSLALGITVTDGQQTADGGFIMSANASTNEDGYMAILIKLDTNGDLVWWDSYQDTIGMHGAETYSVLQTADGGYIMGGLLVNSLTKVLIHGNWIAKIGADGTQLWFRTYTDDSTLDDPNSFVETPAGDLVAVGNKDGKPMLSKFDAAGNLLWNFTDDRLPGAVGNDLVLTSDGGCVAVCSGNGSNSVVFKVNNVFILE